MKRAVINWAFSVMPAMLITARHEFRHRNRLHDWIDDDPFFIHVPKSGGTSIAKGLLRAESGHFSYARIATKYPRVAEKSAYYFVLRDPIARILSTYAYLLRVHGKAGTTTVPQAHMAGDINAFVQNYLAKMDLGGHYFLRPVSEILKSVDPERTFAVNFDELEKSLNLFLASRGRPAVVLPHENSSGDAIGRLALDDCSVDIISNRYSVDIAMHQRLGRRPFGSLASLLS